MPDRKFGFDTLCLHAGQMPDRLAAVSTTYNDEANVRVSYHIRDQTLDPQIFRVQRSDDRYFGKPRAGHGVGQCLIVERTNGNGRMVAQDRIGAG